MQVRDGPAAVRGDALRHDATGPRGREGGGRGSPESEDLPPAAHTSNPSRKEDSVLHDFVSPPRPGGGARAASSRAPRRCAAVAGGVPGHDHRRERHGDVPEAAARIVSLSPTATESLFAIGAGPQVVAVDDQSDYPKSAPRTTLSGFTPNVEAIAGYKPDLVVVSYDPNGLVARCAGSASGSLVQDAATTLTGAYEQIRQLGTVTGQRREADTARRRG